MRELLLEKLVEMAVLFQSGQSPEEIAVTVDLFAEALAGEKREDVERALALYRRQGKRFPTPAHILEILPECREKTRLPALDVGGTRTPGFGRMMLEKFRAKRAGAFAERIGAVLEGCGGQAE